MGITFRHDAAAGLIGSYAAGQAAGSHRRQKYAMAALLQDRRHRQRLEELGGRGVRGRARLGARGGAAGDQIVGFHDPLDALGNTVHGAAARRARDRKERLEARGKNYTGSSFGRVPDSSRRIPITQADVDRQDKQLEADAAAAAAERDRLEGIAGEERTFTREILGGDDFSDADRAKGNKILADIAALEGSPQLSEQDEQAKQAEIAKLEQDLQDVLDSPTGIPKTSTDDMGQEKWGDKWEGAGLNEIPWEINDEGKLALPDWIKLDDLPDEKRIAMGLRPVDNSAAEQKQKDTQDKAIAAQQKAIESAEDALDKAEQAHETAGTTNVPATPKLKKLLQKAVDRAQGRLDALTDQAANVEPQHKVMPPVGRAPQDLYQEKTAAINAPQDLYQEKVGAITGGQAEGAAIPEAAAPAQPAPAAAAAVAIPAEAFYKAWETLKPGQSLRGPDGKMYIKRR